MIAGRGSYYVVCGGFRIFLENHRSRIYSFDTARNLEFKLKAAQTKPNVVHASNFMFQNQVFPNTAQYFIYVQITERPTTTEGTPCTLKVYVV